MHASFFIYVRDGNQDTQTKFFWIIHLRDTHIFDENTFTV